MPPFFLRYVRIYYYELFNDLVKAVHFNKVKYPVIHIAMAVVFPEAKLYPVFWMGRYAGE